MAEKFSLKDHLVHRDGIQRMARELAAVVPGFEEKGFVDNVVKRFPELELKARIDWIAQCLHPLLPTSYPQALDLILAALPAPCDPDQNDGDFGDFLYAAYGRFVERYGCKAEHLDRSLEALRQITQRFSAEYAIRPFLLNFPEATLRHLSKWTGDPHYHVRRLCSEGTRPRLPWGQSISLRPEQTLPLLESLFRDPTQYVIRSVANHLNDLTKKHPEVVLQTLQNWRQQGGNLDFIERHALRSLVKTGHTGAMTFLGFAASERLQVDRLELTRSELAIGQPLEMAIRLRSESLVHLVLNYRIEFQNKRGQMDRSKIYKWKNFSMQPGEEINLQKRHPLRAQMSTLQLYPGRHRLTVVVNGQECGQAEFTVL